MILGSLAFGKDFWILTQKLGYVIILWPNAFLQSLWYTHDLGPSWFKFFFLNGPKTLGISWLYVSSFISFLIFLFKNFSSLFIFFSKTFPFFFFLKISLLKKVIYERFFFFENFSSLQKNFLLFFFFWIYFLK